MTKEQAKDLATFARQAMPKSSEAQERVLRDAIEAFPAEAVGPVIVKYAAESEFISTLAIMTRIRSAMGGGAVERMERERREAQERYAKLASQTCDPSVAQAQLFCRELEPEKLAEYRAEVEAENPVLAPLWRGKETLGRTGLVCMIYAKFGRILREAWIEVRA